MICTHCHFAFVRYTCYFSLRPMNMTWLQSFFTSFYLSGFTNKRFFSFDLYDFVVIILLQVILGVVWKQNSNSNATHTQKRNKRLTQNIGAREYYWFDANVIIFRQISFAGNAIQTPIQCNLLLLGFFNLSLSF